MTHFDLVAPMSSVILGYAIIAPGNRRDANLIGTGYPCPHPRSERRARAGAIQVDGLPIPAYWRGFTLPKAHSYLSFFTSRATSIRRSAAMLAATLSRSASTWAVL
jgi:hypothetical protein